MVIDVLTNSSSYWLVSSNLDERLSPNITSSGHPQNLYQYPSIGIAVVPNVHLRYSSGISSSSSISISISSLTEGVVEVMRELVEARLDEVLHGRGLVDHALHHVIDCLYLDGSPTLAHLFLMCIGAGQEAGSSKGIGCLQHREESV